MRFEPDACSKRGFRICRRKQGERAHIVEKVGDGAYFVERIGKERTLWKMTNDEGAYIVEDASWGRGAHCRERVLY